MEDQQLVEEVSGRASLEASGLIFIEITESGSKRRAATALEAL